MNKLLSLAAAFVLTLPSFSAHARFTQADTWQGNELQPITLNKYTYANSDPVNHTDPSGHFGLASFGTANNINAILTTTATRTIGLSLLTIGTVGTIETLTDGRDRKWSLWDIMAMSRFNANVSAQSTTATATRTRSPDGHHTIPIYLCGAQEQQLSYIDRSRHAAIHTGLAAVQVALYSAEEAADRLIPMTRRRSGPVMSLAETPQGRGVIANAIQGYYMSAGWWGQGAPTISAVFPLEKSEFIGGKTSLPECKRTR
jgi:hypothetical protein